MNISMGKTGQQTLVFENKPGVLGFASIVGQKEYEGPLGDGFDMTLPKDDDTWGEDSWEKAECKMFAEAVKMAAGKAGLKTTDLQALMGGDLLNQIISAGFAAPQIGAPFLGLYGACSTMSESLLIAASMVNAGYLDNAACATCSHFSTAERQYRNPLEMGAQRVPVAQWTVTGAGCTILGASGGNPVITHGTIGKVIDYGIADANNMGAAMAPAAYDTLKAHFTDTGRNPGDYDLIVTGDLGLFGTQALKDLLKEDGIELPNHFDCGVNIFDTENQDVHGGGSGCGCAASVLNSYLLTKLQDGTLNRILFMATGALLSPTTTLQGETIPSVAHAVVIERSN